MLIVTVPLKTVSGMNAREHHMARARRVKKERAAVALALLGVKRPMLPCTVTMTRLAPSNGLDDDNLASSQKAVRDQVADWMGINDKTPMVTWKYAQQRHATYAVVIEVSSAVQE